MISVFEDLKKTLEGLNTIQVCAEHGGDRCLVIWDRTETGINCLVCDRVKELEKDITAADCNEAEAMEDKEQAENRAAEAEFVKGLAEGREAVATRLLLKQAEQISELEAILDEINFIEIDDLAECPMGHENDTYNAYEQYKEKHKNG